MTPESQTIYSLSLFFSLAFLMLWSRRRQRSVSPVRPTSPGLAPHERVES